MRVFISWSGERSQRLALALHDWLPLLLQHVEPWLSESDIAAGDRWAVQIAKRLEESTFGLLCVTQENIGSPWLLFEAGALAKSLEDSTVVPLLLDLDFSEITGPLSQFQAKKLDRQSILDIVETINQRSESPIDRNRLNQLFGVLWPQLNSQIKEIPQSTSAPAPARSQREVLEDLVSSIRTIDQRMRSLEDKLTPLGPIAELAELAQSAQPQWEIEAKKLVAADKKILAIKLVREHTGLGLKEVKELVDSW